MKIRIYWVQTDTLKLIERNKLHILKQFVRNIKTEIFPVFDKQGDCSRFRWTMVYWFKSVKVSDYFLALGMYISKTMENDYFLPLPFSCSDKMK